MQYADIAVNSKTVQRDLFTYRIPADLLPYLRPGSLVQVPFGNRKLLGVVFKLKKALRNIDAQKLKPIEKAIDPMPILDSSRLELAKKIKDYYLSSLGKVVFAMIPEPARRLVAKEQREIEFSPSTLKSPALILGNPEFRLEKYQQILKRVKKAKKQVLILFSSIDSSLAKELAKDWPEAKIFHARLTTTEKYRLWRQAQKQKISILFGTRQALFLPLTNLAAIIIDNATSDLFKNDQEPFFDLRRVAVEYAQISGVRLFFGDLNPPLEFWPKANAENWPIVKEKKKAQEIKIVNLSRERSILSQSLKEAIDQNLKRKKKIFLFLNRRGDRRLAVCLNCQHSHYLADSQKIISRCPLCQSTELKLTSLGTRGLAKLIREEFPLSQTLTFDSQSSSLERNQALKGRFDILIGTSLVFLSPLRFDLVSIVLPEISLAFPCYNVWEKAFYHLSAAASLGEKVIVQAFNPQQEIIRLAAQNDFQSFFQGELKNRREYQEPPFGSLIKIYSRLPEPIKELKETRKELLDWAKKERISLEVSPIVKPLISKWPYLLLKTKPTIPYQLKKKLLELSKLKIDRDPKQLF